MTSDTKPVLILGAGINGCALARELALNGIPVWVVDSGDIASGATSGSSRLIHGGLRYLEYGEFDLVKESLAERSRLLRLAPQFVRPLKLWIPAGSRFGGTLAAIGRFFGWSWWPWKASAPGRGITLVRAGLSFYDAYAQDPLVPKHTRQAVGSRGAPPVDPQKYRWLAAYYDAQIVFPERLTVAMLADAEQLAATQGVDFRVLNYSEARLTGDTVEIRSTIDAAGPIETIRPAAIVNATGAWVDETLARLHVPAERLMGGTKGSHLFTAHQPLRQALGGEGIYAEAADGRPIFITPLADTILIGTTDERFDGPPQDALTTAAERDYLLEAVNAILPDVRLSASDVDFHYCAVRPLPYVRAASTGAVTRRHWLVEQSGLAMPFFSVVGGKLTTMRSLAQEAAALVLAHLERSPSATSADRRFPGAEDYPVDAAALEARQAALAARSGFSGASVAAAWALYGTICERLLADAGSRDVLAGGSLPIAIAQHAIRREWAMTLADLVERRLMLLYDQRLTRDALVELAKLLAAEGRLPPSEIDAAVTAEVDRLAARYGKRIA